MPGLALRLVDERLSPVWMQDFPPTMGVAAYLSEVTHGHHPLTQPIIVDGEGGRTKVHIAFLFSEGNGQVLSFVNNYRTMYGGAHVAGFLDALRHTLRRAAGPQRSPLALPGITAHMTAIVSVWTPNPLYRRSTRSELYGPEVRQCVRAVVKEALGAYFEGNPDDLRRILAL